MPVEVNLDKVQEIVDSMCSYVDESERPCNLFDELNTSEQSELINLVMMHGNCAESKKLVGELFVKYKGPNFLDDQCLERMGYAILTHDYELKLQH